MYHWLDQARLDAVIDDLPIGAWFAASLPALQISPLDATETQYGLVLRRDSAALKTALDEAIGAIAPTTAGAFSHPDASRAAGGIAAVSVGVAWSVGTQSSDDCILR
jgi:hypothetical protein